MCDFFAGRVVVAEPGSWIEFTGHSRRASVGAGERISGPALLKIEARALEAGMQLELREIGVGEVQAWPFTGEIKVEVEVGQGQFYARIFPENDAFVVGQGGVALASPITVE